MSKETTVRPDNAEHLARTMFDRFRRDYLQKRCALLGEMSLESRKSELRHRRANRPPQVDNGKLYAGAPMFFYCKSCGHLADIMPECYSTIARTLCTECQELKDLNALE